MLTQPKSDGKQRVRLYNIAIASGLTKEQADRYADSGVNCQTIRIITALNQPEV